MSAITPPWAGKTAEPERTPWGDEIVRTRHGAFFRDKDGRTYPYYTPEESARRMFRKPAPRRVSQEWDVWSV